MSLTQSDIDFAVELFSGLGDVTSRKMFGGAGFYCGGRIFAICDGTGALYLKSKGDLARRLVADGAHQFHVDFGKGKKAGTMDYWSLPEAALDDPALACELARDALAEG